MKSNLRDKFIQAVIINKSSASHSLAYDYIDRLHPDGLLCELHLHVLQHFLHPLQLCILLFQHAILLSHLIFTCWWLLPGGSAFSEPLRPVILIVHLLSHLLEILHMCDEHGSQLDEVTVVGVLHLTTPHGYSLPRTFLPRTSISWVEPQIANGTADFN